MRWIICPLIMVSASCVSSERTTSQDQPISKRRLYEVVVNGKYGYIDRTGTMVILPRFDNAFPFSEGLALVSIEYRWGHIDESGGFAVAPRFWNADSFHDGRAMFTDENSRKNGYIDRTGAIVIPPTYDFAEPFRGGIARVGIYTVSEEELDRLGQEILDLEGDELEAKRAEFEAQYVKYSLIDPLGNVVEDESRYRQVEDQRVGKLVRAQNDHGLVGYANREGKIVIEPRFQNGAEFSEGLAAVEIDGLWGFIDEDGRLVIMPQWIWAHDFCSGLAPVGNSSGYGYIDRNGEYVWNPTR